MCLVTVCHVHCNDISTVFVIGRYGNKKMGPIPPNSTLEFEIQLIRLQWYYKGAKPWYHSHGQTGLKSVTKGDQFEEDSKALKNTQLGLSKVTALFPFLILLKVYVRKVWDLCWKTTPYWWQLRTGVILSNIVWPLQLIRDFLDCYKTASWVGSFAGGSLDVTLMQMESSTKDLPC